MAAKEMQFPWRWTRGTISTNLDVVWEMSAQTVGMMRVRRGWAFVIDATIIGILWRDRHDARDLPPFFVPVVMLVLARFLGRVDLTVAHP